jgi:hypothetical protein
MRCSARGAARLSWWRAGARLAGVARGGARKAEVRPFEDGGAGSVGSRGRRWRAPGGGARLQARADAERASARAAAGVRAHAAGGDWSGSSGWRTGGAAAVVARRFDPGAKRVSREAGGAWHRRAEDCGRSSPHPELRLHRHELRVGPPPHPPNPKNRLLVCCSNPPATIW